LTTAENATENLSSGDFLSNVDQFNDETDLVERTQAPGPLVIQDNEPKQEGDDS